MNEARLIEHYERIADAPDATARLRRFILDLAVRGKLVPQDSNEEPASELLKKIAAEKARLVRAGEIRKEKILPEIEAGEAPFSAPCGWEWVRVRKVTSDRGQTVPVQDFTYIDVTAINKEIGYIEGATVVSARDAPSRARKVVRQGDVLYSCVRPYLLNIAIIETAISPAPIASTAFAVLNGFGLVMPRYQWIVLRSPYFVECVEEKMRGQAYPAINDSDFALLPFPLPPLPEQHRIVAKVDELMALCDRLEAARAEREAARDRLSAASLARLGAPGPDTFQADARFALDALPALTTRPDQIKQLRQTILNLAVRGKIVPQDPGDESAMALLHRVALEKASLLQGNNKSAKQSIPRDSTIDQFDVPSSWKWCQLDELSWKITDGDHLTPKREASGRYLLSARNVLNGRIELADVDFVGDAEFERMRSRCDPNKFDMLISCSGSIGRVAIVDRDDAYVMVRSAALVKPVFAQQLAPYLYWSLISECLQIQMGLRAKAAAQPNLFIGSIRQLMIPLPPLAEQRRIVAKVDELMALCDRLEASLASSDATRQRLLEALLNDALNGVPLDEAA